MNFDIPKTNWIWSSGLNEKINDEAMLFYFRKKIDLKEKVTTCLLRISADTRYKLYVNGELVELGPMKGDNHVWFYDEVEIAPYLKTGENVLAAEVLRYPVLHRKGNFGMFRTNTPGLYIKSVESEEQMLSICTDDTWKCRRVEDYRILAEDKDYAPLMIREERTGDEKDKNWKLPGYQDEEWENAFAYKHAQIGKASCPGELQKRTIPSMLKKERLFQGMVPKEQKNCDKTLWDQMLSKKGSVVIPAHSHIVAEMNAGELTCGYLRFALMKGAKAAIKILTSEGYVQKEPGRNAWVPKKADRCDWVNGYLHGFTDTYHVAGYGQKESFEIYEPFWFRTFRFVQLDITTQEEELELIHFDYLKTGYPLDAKVKVTTSDETLEPVWDISLRTLKRCMHETYMDCPFYEQLQYAMDSRSEILYTYMVSADDRLARQCMDDFRRSQRYDGMINSCYPCYGPNVIPGFSIYYIMMVYDHMMYFGDQKLVRKHIGAIDNILNFFHVNLEERGLVGNVGGVLLQGKYWSFIDWTVQWNETAGMPSAGLKGPITMESLLYVMGLQAAAKLMEYIGRDSVVQEYLNRAKQVQDAINQYCRDENGIYMDGPDVREYSQHSQVFAILTDTVSLEKGKENLKKALADTEMFAPCSVAMAFYLFRALEKSGLYKETSNLWNLWREMIQKNVTTCVENNVDERSDCHAWGSLILYELPAIVLGVQPDAPGFEKIRISPVPGNLSWAKGGAMTKWGMVKVEWKKDEAGKLEIDYQAPEGIPVYVEEHK